MKPCVYCGSTTKKLSGEHVISRSVLELLTFRELPAKLAAVDIVRGRYVSAQAVIKDVCVECNSALSPYDDAGARFVKELLTFHDATDQVLPFDKLIFGWLMKTFLNQLRCDGDHGTGQKRLAPSELMQPIIKFQSIPQNKFALFVQGWECEPNSWVPRNPQRHPSVWYFSFRENSQNIWFLNLRIRAINMFLAIPDCADYDRFNERVESAVDRITHDEMVPNFRDAFQKIDVTECIATGHLKIEKTLRLGQVREALI